MSVQIKGSGTIGGIDEGLNITGVITATNFKTGVSNLNSTGSVSYTHLTLPTKA